MENKTESKDQSKEQSNLMKNKNFLYLIISKLISTTGTFVQSAALALFIIDKTESSVLFASVLMATLIPKVVVSPFCGVVVDWLDRKKLLVGLDMLSGALLIIVSFLISDSMVNLPLIYGVSIGLGLISAVYEPTTMAIMPGIVEKEDLDGANSMSMIIAALGNILGPVIGVALYSALGITVVFLVNGISFIIGALLEMLMVVTSENMTEEKRTLSKFKSDFSEGMSYIANHSRLKLIIICILIQNCFFNGATQVGIPFISRMDLKVSNSQFALIEVVLIIGVILGAVLSAKIRNDKSTDDLFVSMLRLISLSFLGIAVIAFGVLPDLTLSFYIVLGLFMVLGITSINVTIAFQSEIQKQVDNKFLGRISSLVLSLIMASIPLGQVLYGWMLNSMESFIPFVITSVVIMCVSAYYKKASKQILSFVKGEENYETTY